MKRYEMVREIFNSCSRNQMRDVYFEEVETDDPLSYVKSMCEGNGINFSVECSGIETVVEVENAGLLQKFTFTED